MAADEIVQEVKITGVEEGINAFDRLAAAGEAAFSRLTAAGDSAGNIGKGIDEAAAAGPQLTDLEKRAEALGHSIGETTKHFGAFSVAAAKAAAAAGAAAVGGMVALATAASKVTEQVRDAAIQAGITVEQFGRLKFAAEQSGASAGKLNRVFAILNAGTPQTEKALAKFGVTLRDGAGNARNASVVFTEFADKIAKIKDPAKRAQAAAEVFGRRAGPGLVELLSEGSKGISALGKEADRLGITFSKAETEVGDNFGDAASKLGGVLTGLATRIGLAFSPKLIEIMNRLSESIAKVAPTVIRVAEVIANNLLPPIIKLLDFLGPVGTAIGAAALALGGIGLAIGVVLKLLGPFAALLKLAFLPFTLLLPVIVSAFGLIVSAITTIIGAVTTFGAVAVAALGPIAPIILLVAAAVGALIVILTRVNWSAVAAKAAAAWTAIKDFVSQAAAIIVASWGVVKQFFLDLWESIATAASDTWTFITDTATAAFELLMSIVTPVFNFLVNVWTTIKNAAVAAWNFLRDSAVAAFQTVKDTIQGVLDFIQRGIDLAKQFAAALGLTGGGGSASATQGLAGGGVVRGPGTSTSDSILARLSRGEFVVKAAAVDKYGVGLLSAINSMRLPLRALRGYAGGGLVDALQGMIAPARYAYAEGGAASTGRARAPIVLNIDGNRFNLLSQDTDTADRLVRFATVRRVKAAGRKPSYHGA